MSVKILETYTRVFVDADDLDSTSSFYQALLGGSESLRFAYPELDLKLAAVSSAHLSILIIAGSSEKRRLFEATRLTIKVEALEPAVALLQASGAEQQSRFNQHLSDEKHVFGTSMESSWNMPITAPPGSLESQSRLNFGA